GWPENGSRIADRPSGRARTRSLPEMIAAAAEPLPDFDDPAFGELFDRFGDRRVVLLGEASHGTSEFYRARAAITRRLIEKHGFTIVAVEADWPDAAAIDRYVRHRSSRADADPPFQRFPTWMWRNTDVAAFVDWMRQHNERIRISSRLAGFYGLDIYNMSGSIAAVLQYLDRVDPQAAKIARERYGCLTPWQNEPSTYGRVALTSGYEKCEKAVLEQCREPNAKAVVWAHNSHIGDARYTEMGIVRDGVNIGQLCRQRFGDGAALIGLGTHSGTVAAASDWDGEMEIKRVRPSHSDSYERLCHDCGVSRFLLD
ncbi:MAG: erythromycin esterase family protein, partial [Mesorhizobium sp.]